MPTNTSYPLTKTHVFSRVPRNNSIVYSTFDTSYRYLSAFDASYLIPAVVKEVYPGDIFRMTGRHLNRLLTAVHPFMDNLTLSAFFFYCPTRLVWKSFKAFMGERRRPDSTIGNDYQVPMLNSGTSGVEVGSIFDYAGIPVGVPNLEFSSLPFRCINLAYNEWFRDENLCEWLQVGGTGSSSQELEDSEFGDSDQLSNYSLFKRAKAHDYFTSCLPFQQKGEAMAISIGSTAPVVSASTGINDGRWLRNQATQDTIAGSALFSPISGMPSNIAGLGTSGLGAGTNVVPDLIADLTNVTGFTISDFRTAMQLQALKELNARSGTRYKEIINGEWNVLISDATLDRPEFLGSYRIPFNIVSVASTSETSDSPQGNLAAYGLTNNDERFGFSKAFEEHGYVIGFLCVTGDQTYQQGLQRFWSRKNRYDFYTPLLANISEQAVKMKEIFAQGSEVLGEDGEPVDEKTFGYQEAWSDLRYGQNMVTGKMRSTANGTLDVWHLATKYAATVDGGHNLGIPLNQDFIDDNTYFNLKRVLAVKDEPQILSDNYFHFRCTRELPLYSVPAYLFGGRF